MVMVANNTGWAAGMLAGRFPGRIGHLFSPDGTRRPQLAPRFALDNGRYAATTKGKPWDESAYLRTIDNFGAEALWSLVPDVVADRDGTLREWDKWAPRLAGLRLAIAVQDGMTPADIPAEASVVFVGGSTLWKTRTLSMWIDTGKPVHVGRVNGGKRLKRCHNLGVQSCDGTGWFRGDKKQLNKLIDYLEQTTPNEATDALRTAAIEYAVAFRRHDQWVATRNVGSLTTKEQIAEFWEPLHAARTALERAARSTGSRLHQGVLFGAADEP